MGASDIKKFPTVSSELVQILPKSKKSQEELENLFCFDPN